MRILVAGSTGLLGRRLVQALETRGDDVWRLDRRACGPRGLAWPEPAEDLEPLLPEGLDALVNLAGSPIAQWPWTARTRRLIRSSRVDSTRWLAQALARRAGTGPQVRLLAGSAVGLHRSGWPALDEDSPAQGAGFLADVVREWEEAAEPALRAGLPVTWLRTGLVLDSSGGLLGRLWPLWRRGLGLRLGSPELPWSWIHAEDWVRAVLWILDQGLSGPVHLCSPRTARQRAVWSALDSLAGRRSWPGPPDILVVCLGGAMARELLLSAPAVLPKRLLDSGFTFQWEELEPSLAQLLGGKG